MIWKNTAWRRNGKMRLEKKTNDNDPPSITKSPLHSLQCVAIYCTLWLSDRVVLQLANADRNPCGFGEAAYVLLLTHVFPTVSMCELFWEVKCNPHQQLSARMPVAIFCALHALCIISMVSRAFLVFATPRLELTLWATSKSCEVSASFVPFSFSKAHTRRPLWNILQTCITWNVEPMPRKCNPLMKITFIIWWQYAPSWWETF